MTGRLEYLTWCADRATFIERMGAYTNPVTGTPLATYYPAHEWDEEVPGYWTYYDSEDEAEVQTEVEPPAELSPVWHEPETVHRSEPERLVPSEGIRIDEVSVHVDGVDVLIKQTADWEKWQWEPAYADPETRPPEAEVGVEYYGEWVSAAENDVDETKRHVTIIVHGHHANFWAVGRLEALLNANGGWEAIFPLLGDMEYLPENDGVPAGWVGTSGMKIINASEILSRARIWA